MPFHDPASRGGQHPHTYARAAEPFYLHGDGVFDWRGFLDRERPIGQHDLDQLAVPALYDHPARTRVRSSSTRLHVLGVIPNAIPDDARRLRHMDLVSDALGALPEFHANGTFFVLFAPVLNFPASFGRQLSRMLTLNSERVRIITMDPAFGSVRPNQPVKALFAESRVITAPYVVRKELLDCGANASGGARSANRSGIMFHGDAGRYDMGARGAVRDILSHINGSDYVTSQFARGNTSALLQQYYPVTIRAMQTASMCAAPRGDTPTSRRLFEVLAAGCVALLLSTHSSLSIFIGHNLLPFPHLLQWEKLVEYMCPAHASLKQRFHPAKGIAMTARIAEAAHVEQLLGNERRLQRMRARAAPVVCRYFDPFGHIQEMLTALLLEAAISLPH